MKRLLPFAIGLAVCLAGIVFVGVCLWKDNPDTSLVQVDLGERLEDPRRVVDDDGDEIVFGFDRRLELKEDIKMYSSLIDYLREETGYEFELHVTPSDSRIVDELGNGKVDIAAVGTLGYLQANELYDADILARGLNDSGDDTYRAAIITLPDSPIDHLTDLIGKSFAFGDNASTQGNLIPSLMLSGEGISLGDLGNYQHFSSHSEVADAVLRGDFDAGSIQDTLASYLESKGLIKVLAISDKYPRSGIVVSSSMAEETEKMQAIRDALLDFDPKGKNSKGIYRWDMTEMPGGFTSADSADYEDVRRMAAAFGLLGHDSHDDK